MDLKKQEYLEQHVCAVATSNKDLINDPNLSLDLFTIHAYQQIIQICKNVVAEKDELAMEEIIPLLQHEHLDDLFIRLIDIAYDSSRYDEWLDQLQTSLNIRKAREIIESAETDSLSFDEMQTEISKLGHDQTIGFPSKWSAAKIMDEMIKSDEKIRFRLMDFYQDVVQPAFKTVNVIAARTGIGKTAYALNLANDIGEQYSCLYFNLEMPEKEIYQRLMAIQSGIPINRFQRLTKSEQQSLSDAAYRFEKKLRIKIYSGSKSIDGIRKIVARECRIAPCIVFIDHIGYITNKKLTNTRERVQQTMIDLNNMTKDFNCSVFALSQLNRDVDDQPKLINLKDSGEVEQTANSVVLLNCRSKDLGEITPEYELICAKNRGRIGIRRVRFNRNNQRFENLKGGLHV